MVLPAKELCSLARTKGLISAVDGAQVTGMMPINLHDMGCDFYTSSPHKWLMSPKGTGYLYVRQGLADQLWSTIVTGGWDDPNMHTAERFQHFGSSNVPSLWGLRASIQFSNQIGMDHIERRHRQLADYIHAEMMKRGAQYRHFARSRDALRDRHRQRAARGSHQARALDVDHLQNPHPRRPALQAPPVYALLFAEGRDRPLPGKI